MNTIKKHRRENNLLYNLRKKGVVCDKGKKVIYLLLSQNPYETRQIVKLCKEYHYVIEYYFE